MCADGVWMCVCSRCLFASRVSHHLYLHPHPPAFFNKQLHGQNYCSVNDWHGIRRSGKGDARTPSCIFPSTMKSGDEWGAVARGVVRSFERFHGVQVRSLQGVVVYHLSVLAVDLCVRARISKSLHVCSTLVSFVVRSCPCPNSN